MEKSKAELRRDPRLVRWLASGEREISSNTIVSYLTGLHCFRYDKGYSGYCHPADPSDFMRCQKLLSQVPSLKRPFLRLMPRLSPVWKKLVRHWDEIQRLIDEEKSTGMCPKAYALMKGLGA